MPIPKPTVDPQFDQFNDLQRAMESFRYLILSIEHWTSPEGRLREWFRHNICAAMFMAAPTFLVFPVVTIALWELETWINSLTAIAGKLIFLPILVMLALISIDIVLKIIKAFIQR